MTNAEAVAILQAFRKRWEIALDVIVAKDLRQQTEDDITALTMAIKALGGDKEW